MHRQAWHRYAGLALALFACGATAAPPHAVAPAPLPQRLSETGLYVDLRHDRVANGVFGFTPQYPLWSDGSGKRRWIRLPPGARIDASNSDAWQFPPGTTLWKEFSANRRVETRMIERLADGNWRYSTYVWKADGSEAELAPEEGIAGIAVPAAPSGRYRILARADCRACHEAAPVPVLGFSALQLSAERDPLAANAQPPRRGDLDLRALARRKMLQGLDADLLATPPRIAARSPLERAALGYLHGNCGHCHNRNGAEPRLPLALSLAQSAHARSGAGDAAAALLGTPLRYRRPGADALIEPGHPERSVLALRLASTDALSRMPPLGTTIPDPAGVELIRRWLHELSVNPAPGGASP